MCLAVPARIVELEGVHAVVELSGVRRRANVAFIEDAAVGEYVLLHAGFAIRKWSDEDVREYRALVWGPHPTGLSRNDKRGRRKACRSAGLCGSRGDRH